MSSAEVRLEHLFMKVMNKCEKEKLEHDKFINDIIKLNKKPIISDQKGKDADEETFITCISSEKPMLSPKVQKSPPVQKLPCTPSLAKQDPMGISPQKHQLSDGKLKIAEEIGKGSFSKVYRGFYNGAVIAVKKMEMKNKEFYNNEKKRFEECKHKNIVRLIDAKEIGNSLYLILEYMPNGTLYEKLNRNINPKSISWIKRFSIAADVASGIACLHIHQCMHRDIKSMNILLSEDWTAKLGDFGIVRDGPNLCKENQLRTRNSQPGTPAYMAKEVRVGLVTEKSDTFSYGVVLLELLSGKNPVEAQIKLGKLKTTDFKTNLLKMLDQSTKWNSGLAINLYGIARLCLNEDYEKRPSIIMILPKIQALCRKANEFCLQQA